MVDKNSIKKQWEAFQQGKDVDFSVISRGVYDSWVRSRQYHVDPYHKKREFVPPQQLQELLENNREFINSASTIMSRLFKSIDMLNGTITLADKNGVVLYSCYQNRHDIAPSHVVGDILSEQVCGTNGIGTCLAEGSSVELVGAEHYSLEEHAWYCSAAPVYDDRSNVIGVFNISIPCESHHYYQTSGLVEAVAHAITEQIFLSDLLSEQVAIMDALDEGVVVLNADGVIKSINRKACSLLKLTSAPEGQNFRRIFHTQDNLFSELAQNTPFHHREVTFLNGIRSISCLLSFSPIPGRGSVLTLQENRQIRELASRAIGAKAVYTFDRILGESRAIQQAIRMGRNAAQSDITTLILGDSGTGKELFAQSIHNASARRRGPFIVVNCGAIPRNLVQSELFGYNEGAFTGAVKQGKPGKFELADGGTIFLDEIGEMPLEAQVSLLRLLQNGEVTRVGGKKSTYVNVRVIAATNRNLQDAVAQNIFRKDLYYRLNAFVIHIGGSLSGKILRGTQQAPHRLRRRCSRRPEPVQLARQRAGTGKLHRTGGGRGGTRAHHAGGSALAHRRPRHGRLSGTRQAARQRKGNHTGHPAGKPVEHPPHGGRAGRGEKHAVPENKKVPHHPRLAPPDAENESEGMPAKSSFSRSTSLLNRKTAFQSAHTAALQKRAHARHPPLQALHLHRLPHWTLPGSKTGRLPAVQSVPSPLCLLQKASLWRRPAYPEERYGKFWD